MHMELVYTILFKTSFFSNAFLNIFKYMWRRRKLVEKLWHVCVAHAQYPLVMLSGMWDIHTKLMGADPQETTDVWQAAGSLPWDICNSTRDLCLDK